MISESGALLSFLCSLTKIKKKKKRYFIFLSWTSVIQYHVCMQPNLKQQNKDRGRHESRFYMLEKWCFNLKCYSYPSKGSCLWRKVYMKMCVKRFRISNMVNIWRCCCQSTIAIIKLCTRKLFFPYIFSINTTEIHINFFNI